MCLAGQIEPVIASRSGDVTFMNPMLAQVMGIRVGSIE
jgi:hypothetical protein